MQRWSLGTNFAIGVVGGVVGTLLGMVKTGQFDNGGSPSATDIAFGAGIALFCGALTAARGRWRVAARKAGEDARARRSASEGSR